jgi:acyl-CoA thioesterase I
MRIWIFILGAALLVGGIIWFFSSQKSEITNYPSGGTDIIAFGDSLVSGAGATKGNDFVSLLSKRIGTDIINLGVPGNTTADGLARLYELDAYNPKIVILLLGGNDHLKRVPIETTFHNLEKIVQAIQAKGAIVLLLGVKGNLFGDNFESQFESLRDTYHTAYVPNVLDGLFGNQTYMADAVHPNDAGNKIIAERVYPVLEEILN